MGTPWFSALCKCISPRLIFSGILRVQKAKNLLCRYISIYNRLLSVHFYRRKMTQKQDHRRVQHVNAHRIMYLCAMIGELKKVKQN